MYFDSQTQPGHSFMLLQYCLKCVNTCMAWQSIVNEASAANVRNNPMTQTIHGVWSAGHEKALHDACISVTLSLKSRTYNLRPER